MTTLTSAMEPEDFADMRIGIVDAQGREVYADRAPVVRSAADDDDLAF